MRSSKGRTVEIGTFGREMEGEVETGITVFEWEYLLEGGWEQ